MDKKNILMISPMFPYPAFSGDRLRILNSIKELSKYYNITLICLSEENPQIEQKEYIRQYCNKSTVITNSTSKKRALIKFITSLKNYSAIRQDCSVLKSYVYDELNCKENKYDYIYCHFYHSMEAIDEKIIASKSSNIRIIVDEHNADELIWNTIAENSSSLVKIMSNINIYRIKNFKKNRSNIIDYLVSVSKADLNYNIKYNKIKGEYLLVPNGVNNMKSKFDIKDNKNIVFVGSMDVTMNIEAVLYFYNNIYSILKKHIKDCKFFIVGKNPANKIINIQRQDKSVIVTGSVEDVNVYYENAKVCIAPFKIGGGTKLKILEAMMMKRPLISTSCGCQGIDVENKKHLIIEDDDIKFATYLQEILENKLDVSNMINNAYNLANEKYTWESIFKNMVKRIEK